MDPEKIFRFLSDNGADWLRVTVMTLIKPMSRFEVSLSETSSGPGATIIGQYQSEREFWLHPKLIAYTILSLILGVTINALIPGVKMGPQLFTAVVILLVSWTAYGSVLHIICRLLGGTGRYVETLSVSLQVLGALYVAASFLSLVIATLMTFPSIAVQVIRIPSIGDRIVAEPILTFFVIGTILHMIYIPLALRSVHRFDLHQTIGIALVPFVVVWFSLAMYFRLGLRMLFG